MLSRFRRLQPYLLLALFALPAIWPFFHPGLPRSNDHLIHFYRVVELDRLVRAGVFFPRWAPDLVHGYGYPVFNFVFSLAHGIVEVFHLLGPNLLVAYKATLILTLLCSAWFAYGLGREYFGEQAGLVTGLAYLYSPYLLYDIHIRGSLTESLMLALLPLALLHLRRAARGHRASVAWAGVAVAACVLAHHATMLQAMPFLGLYALWEAMAMVQKPSPGRLGLIRNLPFAILPFAIAALLSAFFWLPAIAESRYIQVERGTLNAAMLYSNNFVSMSELTAFPRLPVDPDLLNPPVVRPLSLAALAIIVVVGLVRFPFRPRSPTPLLPYILFFATLSLTATLLALPAARPLWDMLPLLRLTQFPWRILGPNSLFVALIAGSLLAESSTPDKWQFAIWNLEFGAWGFLLCLTPCALILAGLPFASPPFEAVPAAPTLADVARFETPPTFIGTTTTGEYLPIWVKQLPDTAPNRDKLIRGEAIERFETLPSPVEVVPTGEPPPLRFRGASPGLGMGAIGDSFTVTSVQPVTFVYRTFYFPGWRATLDGQSAPIRITYPEGLMAVDLPGGTHTLAFQFGTTPPRVVGTVLSLAGLVISAALLMFSRSETRDWRLETIAPEAKRSGVGRWKFGLGIWILGFGISLARPLLYDTGYTPLLRRGLQPDGLFGVTHPLNQDLAGELTLLGWDANRETGGADGSFTVNLYWKANHPLGVAYGFDVRLVDAGGLTWSEPDPPRPRDWRFTPGTDFWPEDQYIMDSYVITPLVGTPPGEYTLQVTVFARHNLQTIGTAQAGTLTINAPSRARRCTEDPSRWGPFFGDVINLKTLNFTPAQAAPGDDVLVSLCWHADHEPYPSFDWSFQLELIGEQGTVISQPRIIAPGYPTSRWKMGDVMRDQWRVRLPASLETGDYHWQISAGVTSWVGSLHVAAPPRMFTAPSAARTQNADLGPVTLFGVDVSPASAARGAPLTVTFVWKADELMDTSYHVFLHLLGPDGTLVTQSDGVPADWTRRTTGWLPGEFVVETRTLTLPADAPPGEYTLWAGMYAPESKDRLTTSEFSDGRVPLGTVQVGP
jgi:hypothetical protein